MISAIIIDDNKRHREDVVTLLVDFPDINVVAQCANGFEGLEAIAFLKPQLVFLDVDMPNLNGFEMLEKIANIDFDIIFTTAFGEYAIQAFEIACLDYLTKPLNRDRFKIAMDRFNLSKGTREKLMHYQILIENQKKINSSSKKIALRDGSGTIHLFPINSIVYCSSAKVEDSNGAYTVFILLI
ncbi:MAG: response regulator [Bacteroidetes bacterium]|nr:response regulator [Bacteroidota bacterium]